MGPPPAVLPQRAEPCAAGAPAPSPVAAPALSAVAVAEIALARSKQFGVRMLVAGALAGLQVQPALRLEHPARQPESFGSVGVIGTNLRDGKFG